MAPRDSDGPKFVQVPQVFAEALEAHLATKAIFDVKSASFRKDYHVWVGDAKTDATCGKRIEQALAWIADGKGRFWRYAK